MTQVHIYLRNRRRLTTSRSWHQKTYVWTLDFSVRGVGVGRVLPFYHPTSIISEDGPSQFYPGVTPPLGATTKILGRSVPTEKETATVVL